MKAEAARVARASSAALVLAVLLLVSVVLPAEYGWDPLGSGELLGVMGFSESGKNPLQHLSAPLRSDEIVFQLSPFESVEYKYRLEEGASIVFEWQASGEALSEMHAEPDGAAPGYADSFSKIRSTGNAGTYRAPYAGIHGWFWQNRGSAEITLRLQTQGFFDYAIEYRDGGSYRYDFNKEAADQP